MSQGCWKVRGKPSGFLHETTLDGGGLFFFGGGFLHSLERGSGEIARVSAGERRIVFVEEGLRVSAGESSNISGGKNPWGFHTSHHGVCKDSGWEGRGKPREFSPFPRSTRCRPGLGAREGLGVHEKYSPFFFQFFPFSPNPKECLQVERFRRRTRYNQRLGGLGRSGESLGSSCTFHVPAILGSGPLEAKRDPQKALRFRWPTRFPQGLGLGRAGENLGGFHWLDAPHSPATGGGGLVVAEVQAGDDALLCPHQQSRRSFRSLRSYWLREALRSRPARTPPPRLCFMR